MLAVPATVADGDGCTSSDGAVIESGGNIFVGAGGSPGWFAWGCDDAAEGGPTFHVANDGDGTLVVSGQHPVTLASVASGDAPHHGVVELLAGSTVSAASVRVGGGEDAGAYGEVVVRGGVVSGSIAVGWNGGSGVLRIEDGVVDGFVGVGSADLYTCATGGGASLEITGGTVGGFVRVGRAIATANLPCIPQIESVATVRETGRIDADSLFLEDYGRVRVEGPEAAVELGDFLLMVGSSYDAYTEPVSFTCAGGALLTCHTAILRHVTLTDDQTQGRVVSLEIAGAGSRGRVTGSMDIGGGLAGDGGHVDLHVHDGGRLVVSGSVAIRDDAAIRIGEGTPTVLMGTMAVEANAPGNSDGPRVELDLSGPLASSAAVIDVQGIVDLGAGTPAHGVRLDVTDSLAEVVAGIGDARVIVAVGGTAPANGTFVDLPEGSLVGTTAIGRELRITYAGGDGNDVAIVAGDLVTCLGDVTLDGAIDFGDLLVILTNWGTGAGDLTGDGLVDFTDLLVILTNWGACRR